MGEMKLFSNVKYCPVKEQRFRKKPIVIFSDFSKTFFEFENLCHTVGGKNPYKLFCSHFMSFYPIDFIFIGCIGEVQEFFWVPRNFGF